MIVTCPKQGHPKQVPRTCIPTPHENECNTPDQRCESRKNDQHPDHPAHKERKSQAMRPAVGCFLEGWCGALLYHSFLSWSLLCRSLAALPFTSMLYSYAPCEQDVQIGDHTFSSCSLFQVWVWILWSVCLHFVIAWVDWKGPSAC